MTSAKVAQEFSKKLQQSGSSGLVPKDERWIAIEVRLLRAFRHVPLDLRGDIKPTIEQLIKAFLDSDFAEEVVALATSQPRLVTNYWLPRILEIVAFAEYGMTIPRITERYRALLMTGQRRSLRELTKELQRREGSTSKGRFSEKRAVESEANMTLVEVHKRLAKLSAYAVENFHSYLWTTFRHNLLKAVCHDDVSLPANDHGEETEWAKKIKRRKKQSLDKLQQFDGENAEAALKNISPQSPEEAVLALNSARDLLRSIPNVRLRKVAILRYVQDLTQAETAKELGVTERTVRADEEKIKALLREKLIS